MMFDKGRPYNRRADLHGRFGGQRQGGISTPSQHPLILLFTGESGEEFGYSDGWDTNGVYRYTGEGQRGDMKFVRGNRAVRDHVVNGRDLYLFETQGKGKCQYLGQFACVTYEVARKPDHDGRMRQAIVFHLIPVSDVPAEEFLPAAPALIAEELLPTAPVSLAELRRRALASATEAAERSPREARGLYYKRSADVRAYVLGRANGKCEACGQPAPFNRPDCTPYLEPHHTQRISDGGPDHPRWVAALCPNCHREAHYGAERQRMNGRLQHDLALVEEE